MCLGGLLVRGRLTEARGHRPQARSGRRCEVQPKLRAPCWDLEEHWSFRVASRPVSRARSRPDRLDTPAIGFAADIRAANTDSREGPSLERKRLVKMPKDSRCGLRAGDGPETGARQWSDLVQISALRVQYQHTANAAPV